MAKDGEPSRASQDSTRVRSPSMADNGHASISSQGGRRESLSMHASVQSLQSDNGETASSVRRPGPPRTIDYGSFQFQSPTPARSSAIPPTPGQTPKRPSVTKRSTSSAAPHRGAIFSVDDDPEEVDQDLKQIRNQKKQEREKERERQQRRRESTIRRRTTAQPPRLQPVASEDDPAGEVDASTSAVTGSDLGLGGSFNFKKNDDPSSEETLQGEDDRVSPRETFVEPVEEPPVEEEEEDEEPLEEAEETEETNSGDADDDDSGDLSDAESFTLKDRQEAINETHPFGIRIWKPALYKKTRSVQREAESNIHSAPESNVRVILWIFNGLWTILFGWWLSMIIAAAGFACMLLAIVRLPGCTEYGRVLINLAHYIFFPFGKYVRLEVDEAYLEEDEGEGRSIGEYERWQTGDLEEGRLFFGPVDVNRSIIGRRRDEEGDEAPNETDSLLGRTNRQSSVAKQARTKTRNRMFGRGEWNCGRVLFYVSFYMFIAPCLLLVSGICWFLVFSIPMGKVTLLLFYHLRRHPLALSFHVDSHYSRINSIPRGGNGSAILLCTYRAVGSRYWKYTIDGTNIILINLLGLVAFTIFDFFVLYQALGWQSFIASSGLIFVLALASIIPLAYFIGQAVASISAQSSMGVGATTNAFFSTVVEVFLYCIALKDGKAQLVEGSIIGSIFAGILFLPGLSMCFGALKRKTQRFNVRSAGVTSTMLLFAVIGSFGPTLFYQIYGTHELNCHECRRIGSSESDRDCRRCFFSQVPAIHGRFFQEAVRPYIYIACVCLFLSYVVGLLFTLRTHAAVIWNNESDEKKEGKAEPAPHRHDERMPSIVAGVTSGYATADELRPGLSRGDTTATQNIRDSQMYRRVLSQSLKQVGLATKKDAEEGVRAERLPHVVPPKTPEGNGHGSIKSLQGLSSEDNQALFQQVAEMAATAAVAAARDATSKPGKKGSGGGTVSGKGHGSLRSGVGGGGTVNQRADMTTSVMTSGPTAEAGQLVNPALDGQQHGTGGGHDAPNWSRGKSVVILLVATVFYAVIAEILVDTVDSVLDNIEIDEKFLGITLFALVPNTTEFLNAISFAMNGNVALSMEIGGSYALQVILLQAPCLVLFSAIWMNYVPNDQVADHTFSMIYPQWDMVTVILGVFLMGWVVDEGKSNYFKGSILIFTYLVVIVGFYFSGYDSMDAMGVNPFDTLSINPKMETYYTIGRMRSGQAY